MNYYDHHIRDYDAATSHLSWEEDLAYTRLLRWYYRKEAPIPADIPEACRQVRATTKPQKAAVARVLQEFFVLGGDGWRNKTCDEAIERFLAGEPEREVKKANEDNRLKKHREERAKLFKALTDAGGHAPWNMGIAELRTLVERSATLPETPEPPLPATPATATQTPVPSTHTPVVKTIGSNNGSGTPPRAPENAMTAADVSKALIGWERERHKAARGITASQQQVIELADLGITPDELRRAYDSAVADRLATDDPTAINAGFVKTFVEKNRRPPRPQKPKTPAVWSMDNNALNTLGRELGIGEGRTGESRETFIARIQARQIELGGRAA